MDKTHLETPQAGSFPPHTTLIPKPVASFLRIAALVLLLGTGLFASLTHINFQTLARLAGPLPDPYAQEAQRFDCLLDALPQDPGPLGFVPSLPKRMEDPTIQAVTLRVRGDDYRRLYQAQFVLAPRTVAFHDGYRWVVGNFPDQKLGLEYLALTDLQTVKDCGNGVFLLTHEPSVP